SADYIDLTQVDFDDADLEDFKTAESSVSAYFPDYEDQIAQANQCLASMYDEELELTNPVTVTEEHGQVFVSDFATDKPNVINYSDIAGGKTIKLDNADGYQPTADSLLVAREEPDTTEIGQLNFEGWSSAAGAQQDLTRHILLDLSDVTGTVTIDGLEMGAIWAPNAVLNFESGVTTNGQWVANEVTTSGAGEIHHHTFD